MEKILAIRLGAIGDVILTAPALLNLKLSFPSAEISLLTRRHVVGLAEYFAGVDRVLPFPLKASALDLFRMGEYLDRHRFDRVIDLHGNIRSFYLTKHLSASVKVKYNKRRFERMRAVWFNRKNENAPHTIDLYNDAVLRAGGKLYASRPVINLAFNRPRQLNFDRSRKTVVIAPGASYPTKQWPLQRFASLAIDLHKQFKCNIVLVLTGRDRNIEMVAHAIDTDKLITLIDAKLEKLASVISESSLLVSNDSALAHLGSAVGTPVVAIFGPTHPTLGFAPRGLRDSIIQVDEPCRPCSLHGKRSCWRSEQFCFTRISPEHVLEKIGEQLESNSAGEKAIFIDRDGTLIKEKNFISNPDDIEPEDKAVEAIKIARRAGFKIIVVSNQSGVARGCFDESVVRAINQRILDIFKSFNAGIDDILYCPHLPGAKVSKYDVVCNCRKPAPGMIETAARNHNINPFKSFVIGDKLSDVSLAHVAGCKALLVRTGYGTDQEKLLKGNRFPRPEKVLQNLYEGVKYMTGI